MARIALAIGLAAVGALTGGLAWAECGLGHAASIQSCALGQPLSLGLAGFLHGNMCDCGQTGGRRFEKIRLWPKSNNAVRQFWIRWH
jgi:hypothetical protein